MSPKIYGLLISFFINMITFKSPACMWTEIFTMSGQFQALEARFYNLHISPLVPKTQEISFKSKARWYQETSMIIPWNTKIHKNTSQLELQVEASSWFFMKVLNSSLLVSSSEATNLKSLVFARDTLRVLIMNLP